MSLGFRLPNFSNSAGPSGLGLLGKLGNWEVCTSTDFPISHIVLIQIVWGLLGNWEICTSSHFPICQFPKSCWPIWAGVFREIGELGIMHLKPFPNFPNSTDPECLGSFGKLGNMYLKPFPNFSIFQIMLAHLGWGLLGNWEVWLQFPISQIMLSQMGWGLLGNFEFGNWIGRDLFIR